MISPLGHYKLMKVPYIEEILGSLSIPQLVLRSTVHILEFQFRFSRSGQQPFCLFNFVAMHDPKYGGFRVGQARFGHQNTIN